MSELVTSDAKTGMFPTMGPRQERGEITSFSHFSKEETVPLKDLTHWPRVIECPACREPSITRVHRKIVTATHLTASILFVCTVVGVLIPYLSKSCRDVEHYCCRCNRRLVTYHFSTGTEIHVF